MKCPVCQNVYSYGRMISHLCGGKPSFFGSIFNKRTHEYQWNCTTHLKVINPDLSIRNDIEESSRFELLNEDKSSKILYPWNCQSNQDDAGFVINLTISNKLLVYE
jgi:hypothetical protein